MTNPKVTGEMPSRLERSDLMNRALKPTDGYEPWALVVS